MYKQILNYLNEDKMALQTKETAKDLGLLSVEKGHSKQKNVILLDINALPSEYKNDKEGLKKI